MIHPEEVAHGNYSRWEQTIDAYLRSHSWGESRSCVIGLAVYPSSLRPVLNRYEASGWIVGHKAFGRKVPGESSPVYNYTFELPDYLVTP